MTPVQSDCRHCAACDRQIIDFSKKTDAELLTFLQQNRGKICGRFSVLQLERPLMAPRLAKRSGLTAIAASFAAVMAAQQPTGNQTPEPLQTEQVPAVDREVMGKVMYYNFMEAEDSVRSISGRILDELDQPLFGVAIAFADSKLGTVTDAEGNFSLKIPMDTLRAHTLEISLHYFGFEHKNVLLPKRVLEEDLALLPTETMMTSTEPQMLMGVMMYDGPDYETAPKSGLKSKVRQFMHKLFD